MEPKISIIIPVYNELKYLRPCVESVLNQTNVQQSYEIILVDDGSNNGAENDCDSISLSNQNVVVLHKENGGLSSARITGLSASKGEWVMFMDHDDLLSPNILSDMCQYIDDDELDIIACGRVDSDEPDNIMWDDFRNDAAIHDTGINTLSILAKNRNQHIVTTPLWGKLYRKVFLDSINLEQYKIVCPTIYFEDVLMTPIIYSKARYITTLKSKLYAHREVPTSVSRSGKLSSFYYEQIESGNILLQYCLESRMFNYYSYQLGIYLNTLARIYILLPNYLGKQQRKHYEKAIKGYFNLYYKDFIHYEHPSYILRIKYSMFLYLPKLLRSIYSLYKR